MAARVAGVWVLGLVLLAASCVTRQPIEGQPVTGLDRKLSTFAFIEEGRLVTLIVGTRAARDRDETSYIPLEIAVANNGLRTLTLTRESFTLIDEQGQRYPMATARELIENYAFLDWDRRLGELQSITFNKFSALARYPSKFSPTEMARTSFQDIVRDRVSLPRYGYIIDYIYFPKPETGIRGHTFELFLDAPELEDPAFVRFNVR